MDLHASAVLAVAPDSVFAEVADLTGYPRWLGVVQRADLIDDAPAWSVELGARVGPVRRTKRVRMIRTAYDPPTRVRFERVEEDGRDHSAWVLRAELSSTAGGTELRMHLHYGGRAWVPGLDLLLGQEVRRAGGRLARCLA